MEQLMRVGFAQGAAAAGPFSFVASLLYTAASSAASAAASVLSAAAAFSAAAPVNVFLPS